MAAGSPRGVQVGVHPERDGRAMADVLPGNSVQKVCALLRALAGGPPQRLSELSATTGLNKVTALRILNILAREGFVVRAPDGRGYEPGPEIVALGASTGLSHDVREVARPSLVRLADLSEDTVLLSIRSGVEAVCLDREIGAFPIRANYLDIGSRRPLGIGAGSLALLVRLPDPEIDAILGVLADRLAAYPLPHRRSAMRSRLRASAATSSSWTASLPKWAGSASQCWTRPAALLRLSALRPFPSGSASGRPYSGRLSDARPS